MADIKTKDRIKGTIKSIDRASVATDRMKHAYAKTKEVTNSNEQSSPSYFAEDQMKYASRKGVEKSIAISKKVADVGRQQAIHYVKTRRLKQQVHNMQAVRSAAKNRTATINAASSLRANERTRKQRESYMAAQKMQAKRLSKNRSIKRMTANNSMRKSKNRARIGRRAVVGISKSVKAIISGTKALIAAISAGGMVALVVVIICTMFGAAFYFFGDEQTDSYQAVSAEVEAYTPVIRKYANEYGVGEYTELIKAIMMQESGGRGNDPMQASESGFNKKYSHKPNSINDPEYSIQCGVQAIASTLKQAKVSSPVDMDHIKLALQGYNFGNGYISWAVSKYGGYSKANAEEFSKQQAKKHGWSSYGDTEYVDHVLRYYPYGNYTYDVVNTGPGRLGLPIKGMSKKNISSHFGPRSSPGGIGSTNHQGLDIGFPTGTHVLSCENGTVTHASWKGGYGNCIIVDHGNGISTLYGHLSKIHVKKGQKVVRGQFIGEVGSTGNSTGPHLHLGVLKNGSYVNPEKGWVSIP